ncbi:hypothetical protein [Streptomyces sp. TLI_171]|uniref:hypothetical protein n=1 Tax=Streptomyces sp. TLI_171 TaxID=1938859 RepID=UPI000C17A2A0|nr:hypothetical protein [Streptomyces sp. TLI_171]RKE03012.1 hypothetical protein BX266_7619 [Streptomyces sp. TLI_171]
MNTWTNQLTNLLEGAHTSTGDPLDAGARIVVTESGGTEAFRAPLARHWREDEDDPRLLWIRPVVGGGLSPEPGVGYVFNLSVARRRAVHWRSAEVDSRGAVVLRLVAAYGGDGQTARIEPAGGAELEELGRWDTFVDRLSPKEEQALEELAEDSWSGRFA